MRTAKMLLILSHRYIGIPLSFMFVVWFVSAFFMIYTGGMPRITPDMQIDGAGAIDVSRIRTSPQQAAAALGYAPPGLRVRSVLDRPVYEFSEPGYGNTLVYADNGAAFEALNEEQSRQLASDFLAIPASQFSFAGILHDVDQWSLTNGSDLPLYKFIADDGLGTEVYVSPEKAIVSVYTTSQSRLLAWVGTIPHWLYFTSLRLNQPLWYDIVVWSAGIGCVMALLGLALGVTQFRSVRPFSLKRAIPYQGMMRWHYILGVIFGIFTLTWIFSGLLSMEPYAWTGARGVNVDPGLYAEGEMDLAAFPRLDSIAWSDLASQPVKQIEYQWIQGEPHLLASFSVPREAGSRKRDRLHQPYNITGQSAAASVLVAASTGKAVAGFDPAQLVAKLDAAVADAGVTGFELLDTYDNYYYSRQQQLPLPVLRAKFDDPAASWVYVDPERSELLTVVPAWARVERWLYNGLHSLDFAFWYHQRPLWDIGVIFLLAGGLATSLIGLYFGLRRLKLDVVALVHKVRRNKSAQEVSHAGP